VPGGGDVGAEGAEDGAGGGRLGEGGGVGLVGWGWWV